MPTDTASYEMTLKWVGASNWQLSVDNSSLTKFISAFRWTPPDGLRIMAITSSKGGSCKLSNGSITCSGSIAPERCNTCYGGRMLVNFTGTGFESTFVHTDYGGYWISQGWPTGNLDVTAATSFADLPRCAKGHVSTRAKPCAKR
jgi:hypothetical protein